MRGRYHASQYHPAAKDFSWPYDGSKKQALAWASGLVESAEADPYADVVVTVTDHQTGTEIFRKAVNKATKALDAAVAAEVES